MIRLLITPEALAQLVLGKSLTFQDVDRGDQIELSVEEIPNLTGTVGQAMLEVIPFTGEKH